VPALGADTRDVLTGVAGIAGDEWDELLRTGVVAGEL
jgi:hypothetical protein